MQRSYFDHNATTPISPEVLEVHVRTSSEVFGNPSSIHSMGQAARQTLDRARRQVASLLHCDQKEVVFVSGGTEANNTAIFGSVPSPDRCHVITTQIEHPAVLRPFDELERRGAAVTRLPVDSDGIVDPDEVRRALQSNTALISVMHVNNEVGTIQPIAEVSKIANRAGVPIHVDGIQAIGRFFLDVHDLGVDYYSISGHKIYAPKGIGALYVRKGAPFQPSLFGGAHESKRRAGTENVAGAAALGEACKRAEQISPALRDRLEEGIRESCPDVTFNGSRSGRVPNTSNICFDGIEGEAMVIALDLKGFAVSSGSACSSGAVEPSHVLTAMGLSKARAKSSVRFSLGHTNTREEVDALIDAVVAVSSRLRRMSPCYA